MTTNGSLQISGLPSSASLQWTGTGWKGLSAEPKGVKKPVSNPPTAEALQEEVSDLRDNDVHERYLYGALIPEQMEDAKESFFPNVPE